MLNDDEVSHLSKDSEELWLRMEGFGIAYHARYRAKANLSKYLSYATIAAGVFTAISTIPDNRSHIITAFPAVITAVAATISQILSPEKVQRESWDTWKQIESLKSDLASRCRGLRLADNYVDEQLVLKSFSKHLENLLASGIPVLDSHRKAARENFSNTDISPRKTVIEPSSHPSDELVADQEATEAEGVRAITRQVIAQ